jgi:hypothetical protein
MMRALKAIALLALVAGVVAAIVLIAAWPLGAVPGPRTAVAGGDRPPGSVAEAGDGGSGTDTAAADGNPGGYAGAGDGQLGVDGDGGAGPLVTVKPLPGPGQRPADSRAGDRISPAEATPATRPPQQRSTARQRPTGRHLLPSTIVGRADPDPAASGLTGAVQAAAADGVGLSAIAIDRSSGGVVGRADPDRPLPSMSLVKLFIAVDMLDAAGGPHNLDPDTAATLWQMITVSDDGAASRLWVAGGDGAIVQRTVQRFGLTGVRPPDNAGMWGDTTITARDVAMFLQQALADPAAGPWLAAAMQSAQDTGQDGFDQNFGVNTITGAGSKQGWGCCLRGVRSLDSAGFTDQVVVVALAYAAPIVDDATMRADLTATVVALLH